MRRACCCRAKRRPRSSVAMLFLPHLSKGCRFSELVNKACELQLIFSFCKVSAQFVTLQQTLKARGIFHVVKVKGILKCFGWLICVSCCRIEFQHMQCTKVKRGRFRNKICCTLSSVSGLLSIVLIPTVQTFSIAKSIFGSVRKSQ